MMMILCREEVTLEIIIMPLSVFVKMTAFIIAVILVVIVILILVMII